MFDSVILDIVIGLIFTYLLYSLLATIIQEIIATNFAFRAKILEKAITRMLDDGASAKSRLWGFFTLFFKKDIKQPKLTAQFYNHPLIKYLAPDKWEKKPAYLSAQNFSKVIVDLLRGKQLGTGNHAAEIEESLRNKKTHWGGTVINEDTSDYLDSIWVDAQGNIDEFRGKLEDWYNETMDRASGWYKQYTQVILLFVGFGIAMMFNVDTIQIVHKLEKDPKLREQLVAQADAYAKVHPSLAAELLEEKKRNRELLAALKDTVGTANADVDSMNRITEEKYRLLRERRDTLYNQASRLIQSDINKMHHALALGWGNYGGAQSFFGKAKYVIVSSLGNWIKFLGLFLTAIAISLGAPFWFDILSKVIKIRGAIKGTHSTEKHKEPNATVEVLNVDRNT